MSVDDYRLFIFYGLGEGFHEVILQNCLHKFLIHAAYKILETPVYCDVRSGAKSLQ